MGNRLTKNDSGSGNESYSYNNANMLLTRGTNSYTSDADGNTLTGGGRTNTWDSQNRLAQCVYNGNTSSYVYGADGFRHRSTVAGTVTDFALDGQSVIRELRGGTAYATYLTGPSGPMYRRDSSGTLRWYLFDGLGSVLGEVDPSGNLTSTRTYDVYGVARSVTGTPTSKHAFVGNLGHTSEDETALVYMRARYMDPVAGRFISEDPGRNGSDWYVYANGNPVNQADANGRIPEILQYLIQMVGDPVFRQQVLDALAAGEVQLAEVLYAWANQIDGGAGAQMSAGAIEGKTGQGVNAAVPIPVGTPAEVDGAKNFRVGFTRKLMAAIMRGTADDLLWLAGAD